MSYNTFKECIVSVSFISLFNDQTTYLFDNPASYLFGKYFITYYHLYSNKTPTKICSRGNHRRHSNREKLSPVTAYPSRAAEIYSRGVIQQRILPECKSRLG